MKVRDVFRPRLKKAQSEKKAGRPAERTSNDEAPKPGLRLPSEVVDMVVSHAVVQGRKNKDFRPVLDLRAAHSSTRAVVDRNFTYVRELPQAKADLAKERILSFLFSTSHPHGVAGELTASVRSLLGDIEALTFPAAALAQITRSDFDGVIKARLARIFAASPKLVVLDLKSFGFFSEGSLYRDRPGRETEPLFPPSLLTQLKVLRLPSAEYTRGDEFECFGTMLEQYLQIREGSPMERLPLESLAWGGHPYRSHVGTAEKLRSVGWILQSFSLLKSLSLTNDSRCNVFRLECLCRHLNSLVHVDFSGNDAERKDLEMLARTNGQTLQSISFANNLLGVGSHASQFQRPSFLDELPKLTSLDLSYNEVDFAWLEAAGVIQSKSLNNLNLAGTLLADMDIIALGKMMPTLRTLTVGMQGSSLNRVRDALSDLPLTIGNEPLDPTRS